MVPFSKPLPDKPDKSIAMRRSSIDAMRRLQIKLLDELIEKLKGVDGLPKDCLRYQRALGFQEGIARAMQCVTDQCDEEGEYAIMKWREQIRPIVDAVVKQHGVGDVKSLRKALLAARPDYVRTTSHMAKIWREEVKRSIEEGPVTLGLSEQERKK